MQKIDSKTGKYNDDPLQAISDALYALEGDMWIEAS